MTFLLNCSGVHGLSVPGSRWKVARRTLNQTLSPWSNRVKHGQTWSTRPNPGSGSGSGSGQLLPHWTPRTRQPSVVTHITQKSLIWRRCLGTEAEAAAPLHEPPAPTALVVGAGPAGALAAIQLARHGFKVKIAESQQEASVGRLSQRSYTLVLQKRGIEALQYAGVELPDHITRTVTSFTVVRADGKVSQRPESGVSTTRPQLASTLLSHIQDKYPTMVEVLYGHSLKAVHLENKHAELACETGGGGTVQVQYDLLVGADGVNSKVRASMCNQVSGFTFESEPQLCDFKSLTLPESQILRLTGLEPTTKLGLLGFVGVKSKRSILGAVDADGTWRGVYIMPRGGFGDIDSAAGFERELEAFFPQLDKDICSSLVKQLTAAPTMQAPLMIRCSQLHGPGVILIGDAAHGVWPNLGQGCNSALEDVTVLGKVLERHTCDPSATPSSIPAAFNAARHADALGVAGVVANAGFNRAPNKQWVVRRWLLCTVVVTILNNLLPWLVPAPAVSLMSGTTPYADVWAQMQREFWGVGALMTGVVALIILVIKKLLGN